MHPLLDRFEAQVAARADRPAVSDAHLSLTYTQFRAISAGLAGRIAAATQKQRVGILAPSSSAGAAAIYACWYAGKTPVPLNFLLAPQELGKVVADADLDLVLTIDRFSPLVQPLKLAHLLLDAPNLAPGNRAAPPAGRSDVAVVLYTSGTSGDPKGVCLSFDNIVQNAVASIDMARLTPDQVFLSVLPQFHTFGFTTMTIVPLLAGATVHYQARFSPMAIIETIRTQQVTVFMAVASMWGALAHLKSPTAGSFASLRLAISGGEPLSQRIADIFEQRFGVTLLEGYGMTESSPVATLSLPWATRKGSVGRPLTGVTVTPVDENGTALPPGQDGELVIRGHNVMLGYLNKPAETARVLRQGALHTGDVGRVDSDGFVYITGRLKEMMIIGGENVFPFEIEEVISRHPAVQEVAVIGQRDEVRGEVPVAFVILREGAVASETDIRDFCRDRLAGYKIPRAVRIEQDLPRAPTGKILKRALHPG